MLIYSLSLLDFSLWCVIIIGLQLHQSLRAKVHRSYEMKTPDNFSPSQYIFKPLVLPARSSRTIFVQLPSVKPSKSSVEHWKPSLASSHNPIVQRPVRFPLPVYPTITALLLCYCAGCQFIHQNYSLWQVTLVE